MSTLKCNRIENTSTTSGGLDVDSSGKVRVTTLADSSGNNNSTPAEIASGRAKAWVNFNGTGTVAIRDSYNVSSITDNGTGEHNVNFTNAMANANYAVCCTQGDGTTTGSIPYGLFFNTAGYGKTFQQTTSTVKVHSVTYGGSVYDALYNYVVIFGD